MYCPIADMSTVELHLFYVGFINLRSQDVLVVDKALNRTQKRIVWMLVQRRMVSHVEFLGSVKLVERKDIFIK
jgi:hypothetical protein